MQTFLPQLPVFRHLRAHLSASSERAANRGASRGCLSFNSKEGLRRGF